MKLQEILEKRQSIRRYKNGDISENDIRQIVAAAGMAPSGKNIQNWHFLAIKKQSLKEKIAKVIAEKNASIVSEMQKIDENKAARFEKFCTHFTLFFLNAPLLVVVYTKDYLPSGYPEIALTNGPKDILDDLKYKRSPGMQSLGAALENFTLKAIDLGYGSCWLTSANYAAHEIEELLKKEVNFAPDGYFMGAMMSVGVPEDNPKSPSKKSLDEILTIVE